ncbi:DUF6518 family protein [Kineosporia babensis]|uniref:DUF6518 family protein n=1 Tax=Kineosporia babensis TaxID=499548 RepID=A0A9X1NKP2_9ACTN|nr:DUF6518 family protein [Kineosporia babensis]MCD5316065.1 DUF6518 family protein [Kineosporia babensis]
MSFSNAGIPSNAASQPTSALPTTVNATPDIAAATGVATLSFILGAATSYAQGFLPSSVNSLANSHTGWALITVVLIWAVRARPVLAAMLGAGSFVLLTVGYTFGAAIRGYTYDPSFYSLIGLIAGPFIGLAAAWLRERDLRGALATATLTGIAVSESFVGSPSCTTARCTGP